jgi:tetratricopeptide (TPR) repeat protein
MNYDPLTDDELLAQVLCRADARSADGSTHPDEMDELLGLFFEGKLTGEDCERILRFLDSDPHARTTAAAYLKVLPDEPTDAAGPTPRAPGGLAQQGHGANEPRLRLFEESPAENAPTATLARADAIHDERRAAGGASANRRSMLSRLALAASLLVVAGSVALLVWRSGRNGDLVAQRAGYLTQYDYGLDGGTLRGSGPGDGDVELPEARGIERGFALLELKRPADALLEFQADDAESWLGRGIAFYMQLKFSEAESAFVNALQRNPGLNAARLNLAMAIEQQTERSDDALAAWQKVDAQELPADLAARVEEHIRSLREQE